MKPTSRDGILRGGMTALVRLLILAAAGISGYLLSVSLSGGSAVGCGPGSGCDEVLQSRWAYVLGIPVSALALLVDFTLLLTTFSCGPKSTPRQRRRAWEIIVPCSVLILGAALWFVALQIFVLHRFCPWCLAAHVSGGLAAIFFLSRVPVTHSLQVRDKDPAVRRSTLVKFAVAAIAAVALLGVAQTVVTRKTYSVARVPAVSDANTNDMTAPRDSAMARTNLSVLTNVLATSTNKTGAVVAAAATNTSAVAPIVSNILNVFGGRIRLDLAQAPVWGSPSAPFKLISLFDYTCHHCQEMHERVVEVLRSFGDKLAVVSLPVPLDTQCNYLMTRGTPEAHQNACQYARIGLAVWRAKREALAPFDDWLFASATWQPPIQRAPPLTEVTNKAVELVGAAAFEAACRDPWIDSQVRTDIEIYGMSYREFRNGSMPQFMIGTNLVSGTPSVEKLREVVASYIEHAAGPAGK